MTEQLFAVKEWKNRFENNRTKELKKMAWVPIPNSFDGEGYTDIMDRKDGPEIYCAWILIVHIASKSDQRGILIRSNGEPHTPRTLARLSRTKVRLFEMAIPILQDIGWLIDICPANGDIMPIPQEGAVISQEGATIPQLTPLEGKEQKRRELKERREQITADAWTRFISEYPRKENKAAGEKAIENAIEKGKYNSELIEAIIDGAKRYKAACDKDQTERLRIKLPATFINGGCWTDEYKKGVSSTRPSAHADAQERQRMLERAIDKLELLEGAEAEKCEAKILEVFGAEELKNVLGILAMRKERKVQA